MKDRYIERNYIENQFDIVDGVCIDPDLRWDFNITPNEDREQKEIDDWWEVPYITTQGFMRDTYREYAVRCSGELDSEDVWLQKRADELKRWGESFPDGFRYDVRCLDGGAWDRSTKLGHFSSLEDALKFIHEMKR